MALTVSGFVVCSLLIFFHGTKLSYYGDLISMKSGLGRAWVGLVLMASVTSLPELVIGVSSVAVVQSADLAVGNVLGSSVFNLTILSLLDAVMPGKPILTRVNNSNILAAALGTILLTMVGLSLYLPAEIVIMDWIGITSLAFLIVYFVAIRLLHSYGSRGTQVLAGAEPTREDVRMPMGKVILWYSVHAVMVVAAAVALPWFSEELAVELGISESFVGTLLLAASSSLPEVAVSVSAARLGSADMAVGNLFGSNIFNILLLTVSDMFYRQGNLLKDASDSNLITVFATIAMNSIAIAGLTMRPEKKRFHYLAWDTLLILVLYVATMLFLYRHPE